MRQSISDTTNTIYVMPLPILRLLQKLHLRIFVVALVLANITLTSSFILPASSQAATTNLVLVNGNAQSGQVTTKLPTSLTVKAVDENGAPLVNTTVNYTLLGYPAGSTGMSISPQSVLTKSDGSAASSLTLGNKAGTYTVQATVTGSSASTVVFYENATTGPLANLSISPSTALMAPNTTQQFSVTASDQYGNPIASPIVSWRIGNGGGNINGNGLFTAGTATGTFGNTVIASSGSVQASASVIVASSGGLPQSGTTNQSNSSSGSSGSSSGSSGSSSSGNGSSGSTATIVGGKNVGILDHVVITPSTLNVTAGSKTPVSAQGYDVFNDALATISYAWTINGNIGQLSSGYGPNAIFQASTTPGNGTLQVTAVQGDKKFDAQIPVSIAPANGGKIIFNKISSPQKAGTPFNVTITIKDFNDNTLSDTPNPIILTDTTGSINPTVIKKVSAGTWTGEVTIASGADTVVITATSGGFSGSSNGFKVEGNSMFRGGSSSGVGTAVRSLGLNDSNKMAFALISGLGLLGSLLALGLMASKGMQAIGRNPLAKKQILFNLYLNAGIAILGAFISLALALLLKKL